jgi:iron complex transport system ATP-binding protein
MSTEIALRCEGLHKRLGERAVLDGVSLAFKLGQWTAIVGPNGAGKSTLLALLAGLMPPDAGVCSLMGRPLAAWSAPEQARLRIWLGQADSTLASGELAARDVVRLGRLPRHGLFGAPDANDEAAVTAAMRETECLAFEGRRLSQLSGGERQRVLLARALAATDADGPVVWLLDEPTTHLDAPHQRSLMQGLRRRARAGATVLTVLHDLSLALLADRVLVLDAGRVAADGAPGDAALHAVLRSAFGGAVAIHRLPAANDDTRARWAAVPEL